MKIKLFDKSTLFILLTALSWGPSYLLIKVALQSFSPFTMVFARLLIASFCIYFFCKKKGVALWEMRFFWKHFLVLGFLFNAAPFVLIGYSELYITSSLAGILNGLVLIFTSVLAYFFGPKERFTKNKILGIGSGVFGLIVIFCPLLLEKGGGKELGVLLMVLATLFYASGTVYARSRIQEASALVVLLGQLIMATLLVFPLAIIIESPFTLPMPTWSPTLALIFLGVIGTGAGFYFYYKAIEYGGAVYASLTTLLVPVISMVLGALILHEELTWSLYVGVIFILAGVVLVNPLLGSKR